MRISVIDPDANREPVTTSEAPPESEPVVLTTGGANTDRLPIDVGAWFTDTDGTIATIEVLSGLTGTGLEFDAAEREIRGSFTGTSNTTVSVRATDDDGASVDHTFKIMANATPTVVSSARREENLTFGTDMNLPIDLDDWFDDADGDTLTHAATVGGAPLATAGIGLEVSGDEITGTFSGTTNVMIEITARDNHGATSAPHTLIIRATVSDLVGTAGNDDDLTDNAPNWDRTIRGLGGNDTINGGGGNDRIFGDAGRDTAVYTGMRNDYLIRQNGDDFIVRHGENGDMSQGQDTLTGIELIKFGDAAAVALDADLASGNPPLSVHENLGDNIYATPDSPLPSINVSEWFANVDRKWTDYTISGNTGSIGGGFTINGNMLSGQAPVGEVDITITASDVRGLSFDNVSREVTISVAPRVAAMDDDDAVLNGTALGEVLVGLGGNDTISGGGGADIIHGGTGMDIITGGTGNDALYGNTAASNGNNDTGDTAVYEGSRSGYDITAETHTLGTGSDAEMVARLIVRDIITGGSETDEGTDTLTGFEAVRFENGAEDAVTLNVVYATTRGLTSSGDDNATIIVNNNRSEANTLQGLGGADLILGIRGTNRLEGGAGDDTIIGGVGVDTILGEDDDDTLAGGAGDDVIAGNAGDDTIDGGADNDRAAYHGSVGDYAIWQTGTEGNGNPRTFVVHKNDTDTALGRDILTNVETLSFVDQASFAATHLALDAAVAHDTNDTGITTTDTAPTTALNATVGTAIMNQDVSDWFEGGVGTVTYSATGTGKGVSFSSANNMITGTPTAEGTITIMITASHVDDMMYDDVTVTYVINVAAAAGALRAARKDEIVAFSLDEDPRHEADEGYAGLAGPLDGDAFRVESDMDDAAASLSDMDDPCGCFL